MEGDAGLTYSSTAGKWVIFATVLGSAMASIDGTVVGIALPTIGRQFHSPLVDMQWVVTGYMLALTALLIVGGTLGDQFGRRRVFLVGVVWFAVASAACAAAPDVTVLVVTRILQGAGAALLMPGSLAILQATFAPEDRGRAIGAWSGLGGVATAAGPLLGGYLISAVSWRWIFVINLPLAAAVILVTVRHVPETREPGARRVDVAGAVLVVLALTGVTYGLLEGPSLGWAEPAVLAMLIVGAASGALFLTWERRVDEPMVPLAVFRRHQFTATNGVTFLVYAALSGALFLLPVQLQVVDHETALQAGVALLPVTVIMLVLSARSGRLAGRIGPRLQMSVGPVVVGIGLAMLERTGSDTSYWSGALPALVVFGLGLAATVAPLTATALGAVDAEHAGLASAVNNDVARAGGLVAVAVLPALAGIGQRAYLHAPAMASGFRTASFITAGWCVAGGLLAAATIQNPGREARHRHRQGTACAHCALDASPMAVDA
ncbi:MAG TPA: DHA2 family efflux MFS transporter permease subunit [Acidimicrobiales bacterium]|nr:DHA2 family efflux MFS transporter permease subunit [Acidimicrobiales bacterium]